MSDKKHHHEHEHKHEHPPRRKPHQDWRVLVAVALALVGMAVYVLSMDESLQPEGGAPQQQVSGALLDGE